MEVTKPKSKLMQQFVLVGAGALLLGAVIFGASSYRDSVAVTEQAREEQSTADVRPTPPQHYFAMQDGDEYGYEPGVSDDQQKAGQVAAPLVMIRFAGEKKGQYQIFESVGAERAVYDCKKPCEFVRMRKFIDGNEVSNNRIRRVEGSIIYYAMEDAMHGQLAEHFIVKKGQRLTLWYED